VLGGDGVREFEITTREGAFVTMVDLKKGTEFKVDTAKAPGKITRVATAQERSEHAEALLKIRLGAEVVGRQEEAGGVYHVPTVGEASNISSLYSHIFLFHTVQDPKGATAYPDGNLTDLLREHHAMHQKPSGIPVKHIHDITPEA
jgi:hypothetical protein